MRKTLTLIQQGKLLADFIPFFAIILASMFTYHFDKQIGEPCSCGHGTRLSQCFDCTQYEATCTQCWVRIHVHNPFHWAEVWDNGLGFFVRHDISMLGTADCATQLGHKGRACPNPAAKGPSMFTITHTNGVHATRLLFCGCAGL